MSFLKNQQGSEGSLRNQVHSERGPGNTEKHIKVRNHQTMISKVVVFMSQNEDVQRQIQVVKRRSEAVGFVAPTSTQGPCFYSVCLRAPPNQ